MPKRKASDEDEPLNDEQTETFDELLNDLPDEAFEEHNESTAVEIPVTLTAEQLERIERNKREAERRRQLREKPAPGGFVPEEDHQLPLPFTRPAPVEEQFSVEGVVCCDCGFPEVDPFMFKHYGVAVCEDCRRIYPDRYKLITKTEAKDEWLLTEEELRDKEILPHATRPNPLKSHWSEMQLFWIDHVQKASMAKWGSREAMNEYRRKREKQMDERREKKFDAQLAELRKRTRPARSAATGTRHQHSFVTERQDGGVTFNVCKTCGFRVECEEF